MIVQMEETLKEYAEQTGLPNATLQDVLNEEAHKLFYEFQADQNHPMTPRDFIEIRGFDGIGGQMFDCIGETLSSFRKFGSPAFRGMNDISLIRCVLYVMEEMAENWIEYEIEEDECNASNDLFVIPHQWTNNLLPWD